MFENSDKPQPSRRAILKSIAGSAVLGSGLANVFTQSATAKLCKNDCETWPRRDSENAQIERNEYGYTVNYHSGAGFYLDSKSAYFGGGRWHYEFRNEASAGVVKEDSNGNYSKHHEYYGDKHITVEEQNQTTEVNTDYYSDADWGFGVTGGRYEDYGWEDATVDTVNTIIGDLVSPIGAIHSGEDIVDYWKKASKDDSQYNGIDVTWDGQTYSEATSQIGLYMLYDHTFPPQSEFPDSHVHVMTKNKLDDVLFYSDGTERPNGDYDHLTEYKIYVKQNPNTTYSTSSTSLSEEIVPVRADEYLPEKKIRKKNFAPEDTIFVDTDPKITVVREGTPSRKE